MYFFTSSLFLTDQCSSFEMCSINVSLSLFSLLQSYSRRSTVWFTVGARAFWGLYYLESVYVWSCFPASRNHCRKIGCWVDYHLQPVLDFWEEFFCYGSFSSVVCMCMCVCVGGVEGKIDVCKLYACWRLTKPNTLWFPFALPSSWTYVRVWYSESSLHQNIII